MGDASNVIASVLVAAVWKFDAYQPSERCFQLDAEKKRGSLRSGGTSSECCESCAKSEVVPHFISPRMKIAGKHRSLPCRRQHGVACAAERSPQKFFAVRSAACSSNSSLPHDVFAASGQTASCSE